MKKKKNHNTPCERNCMFPKNVTEHCENCNLRLRMVELGKQFKESRIQREQRIESGKVDFKRIVLKVYEYADKHRYVIEVREIAGMINEMIMEEKK